MMKIKLGYPEALPMLSHRLCLEKLLSIALSFSLASVVLPAFALDIVADPADVQPIGDNSVPLHEKPVSFDDGMLIVQTPNAKEKTPDLSTNGLQPVQALPEDLVKTYESKLQAFQAASRQSAEKKEAELTLLRKRNTTLAQELQILSKELQAMKLQAQKTDVQLKQVQTALTQKSAPIILKNTQAKPVSRPLALPALASLQPNAKSAVSRPTPQQSTALFFEFQALRDEKNKLGSENGKLRAAQLELADRLAEVQLQRDALQRQLAVANPLNASFSQQVVSAPVSHIPQQQSQQQQQNEPINTLALIQESRGEGLPSPSIGVVYSLVERSQLNVLEESIQRNPALIKSYFDMLAIFSQHQDWSNAERVMDNVLLLEPEHIGAQSQLIDIYLQTGRKQKAQDKLELVCKQHPDALKTNLELQRVASRLTLKTAAASQ